MKWRKISQYIYKSEDNEWKIYGIITKTNPTRIPHVLYFVKHNDKVARFRGGSLTQAKIFAEQKNQSND